MYLLNFLLIGAGLFNLLGFIAIASDKNTANFQKLVCKLHDKTTITNYSCSTKAVNRYKTTIGVGVFVSRPVHDIMVHVKVYKKFNVVYKPFLVDVKENVCDALAKKPGAAPYTKIGLEMLGSYTNLNHSCPYEGWVMGKEMEINFSKLKLVIPSGEYRFNVAITLNKNPVEDFSAQAFVEVCEKDLMLGK